MRFCEDILKKTVITSDGEKVGKVSDLLVDSRHVFPRIFALTIKPRKRFLKKLGIRSKKFLIYLPWSQVKEVGKKNLLLKIDQEKFLKKVESNFKLDFKNKIFLCKDVLDRQIVDADGRLIDRVDDIKIEQIGSSWRVIGLDIGIEGVLERLGFEKIFKKLGIKLPERMIPWYLIKKILRKKRKILLKVPGEIL